MVKNALAGRVADEVDLRAFVDALEKRSPEFTAGVRRRVESAVAASSTGDLLALTIATNGRTVIRRPEPTPDFVSPFITYLRGAVPVGTTISAGIEVVIQEATRSAAQEFYESSETIEKLSEELVRQVRSNEAVQELLRSEIEGNAQWLKRELRDIGAVSGKVIVADQALAAVQSSVNAALATSTGTAVASMVAKALTLPTVKIAIVKAIGAALTHAAFNKLLVVVMKKAGIGLIVHVALAKLVAGGASLSVGWIVFPIIAGVLVYEYVTLPKKLAKKIGPKVAESVSGGASSMHEKVARTFVNAGMSAVQEELDRLFQDIRERAMREVGP